MQGAIDKAEELAAQIPNSFILGQFVNPANPKAHRETTGPEIFAGTGGQLDFFVATVGTGGTITGTGEFLKSKNPEIKVVAVEPASSPVLSGGKAGSHGIQGIGAGFVPAVLNTEIYDEVITVEDEDAFSTGRLVGRKEGVLVGISSGAALWRIDLIPSYDTSIQKGGSFMMISTRGRYALRVMIDLAEHASQGYIPMKEVAGRQGISLKYLERIMPSLSKSGLVTGIQGYTVGEILRLSEGELAPVACLAQGSSPCQRRGQCKTLTMWNQFYQMTNQFFDGITIAQLMENKL